MRKRTRRKIDAALKAEIALRATREQASVADLAQGYGGPNQIYARKRQLLKQVARDFDAEAGQGGEARTTSKPRRCGANVAFTARIAWVMGHDMTRDVVPALARLGIVFQQPTLDLEIVGGPRIFVLRRPARHPAQRGLAADRGGACASGSPTALMTRRPN